MWGCFGRRAQGFGRPDFDEAGAGGSRQSTSVIAEAIGGHRRRD